MRRRTAQPSLPRSMETDPAASELMTVPLRVRRPGTIDLSRAILAVGDLSWLGRLADGPPQRPQLRRVAADLDLPILDGSSTGPVRKAAFIDVGPARRSAIWCSSRSPGGRRASPRCFRSSRASSPSRRLTSFSMVATHRRSGSSASCLIRLSCASSLAAPQGRSSHAWPRSSSRRQTRGDVPRAARVGQKIRVSEWTTDVAGRGPSGAHVYDEGADLLRDQSQVLHDLAIVRGPSREPLTERAGIHRGAGADIERRTVPRRTRQRRPAGRPGSRCAAAGGSGVRSRRKKWPAT